MTTTFLSVTDVDRSLSKPEYAFAVNQQLILAKKQSDYLFLIIGKLLKQIRDEELYKQLDYLHFGEYLYSNEVSFSKESAFMYIRVYEYYIEELKMSEEDVGKISVSKLSMMIPVLKKMEDKDKIIETVAEFGGLTHSDFMLRLRQTKQDDKPKVYFSRDLNKWIVEYYDDRTQLHSWGNFPEEQLR